MWEAAKKETCKVRKLRFALLLFAMIIHEFAYKKFLHEGKCNSPKKLLPSINKSKRESGEWLELKIFSGVITSIKGPSDVSVGFKFSKETTKTKIPDKAIYAIVSGLVHGTLSKANELKITHKQLNQTNNPCSKKRKRSNSDDDDDDDEQLQLKSGKTTYRGKSVKL